MALSPLISLRVWCGCRSDRDCEATRCLARSRCTYPDGIKKGIKQSPLNTNGMYNSVNLNKKAITLDVTSDKGKECSGPDREV